MKAFWLLLLFISSISVAQETVLYQIRENGTVDRSKPALVVQGDRVYPRRKNGSVDRSGPVYGFDGNKIWQLRRNGTIDRSKPALKVSKPSGK